MMSDAMSPNLPRSSTSGRMIWNSSPPRRLTISLSPTILSSRSATCLSSASPAGWPSVSLTCLKRSRSSSMIAHDRCCWVKAASVVSSFFEMLKRLASPVSESYIASRDASSADRRCSVMSMPLPRSAAQRQLVELRLLGQQEGQSALPLAMAVDRQEQVGKSGAEHRGGGPPHLLRDMMGGIGQPTVGLGRPEPALAAFLVILKEEQCFLGVDAGNDFRARRRRARAELAQKPSPTAVWHSLFPPVVRAQHRLTHVVSSCWSPPIETICLKS